ncbi:MAG TPA: TerC family protein [Verrucomicrobiae bacterium]|jgi:tellurite resistance protein TerC|nr:TerC family protein [Verrucomicrobiae bacterium]
MLAAIEITPWHWVGFVACVLVFLAIDLGVFHRHAHVVRFREALIWTGVWVTLALVFGLVIAPAIVGEWTRKESIEFVTGYLIELSLSMDNVFVIALIFGYFRIPSQFQHRVLFWGILGALIMRGALIGAGVALISMLSWVLYVFAALLIYSGIKMMFVEADVEPEKNPVIRLARKLYPVCPDLDGQKFTTHWNGRLALTPLALVLLMVETTDLVFALDSIPAIFAVTTKSFIIFTSNVFAILGLRSLYFVLAGAIGYFRYLKYGLSLVLVFIGVKMLIAPHHEPVKWFQVDIPTHLSLIVVAGIILTSILASVIAQQREKKVEAKARPDQSEPS